MNNRILSFMLLGVVSALCFAAPTRYTNQLQFKNKTDFVIRVAPGSREVPPYKNEFFGQGPAMSVKPGQTGNLYVVGNDKFPQVMFWQDGKPDVAYVYEINAKPGKDLQVQVVVENNDAYGLRLTSVPFTYNTITKDNINEIDVIDLRSKLKKQG